MGNAALGLKAEWKSKRTIKVFEAALQTSIFSGKEKKKSPSGIKLLGKRRSGFHSRKCVII